MNSSTSTPLRPAWRSHISDLHPNSPPNDATTPTTADSPASRPEHSLKENMAPYEACAYEAQRDQIRVLKDDIRALTFKVHAGSAQLDMADIAHRAELETMNRDLVMEHDQFLAMETERDRLQTLAQSLRAELDQVKENLHTETYKLDLRASRAEQEAAGLKDELEEAVRRSDEAARWADRKSSDLELQLSVSREMAQDREKTRLEREALLQKALSDIIARDDTIGKLEVENTRFRGLANDMEMVEATRRELSAQVKYVRVLEAKCKEQLGELVSLRPKAHGHEILTEEKHALQRRLEHMQNIQAELSEAQIQRQRLEAERLSWAAYLADAGPELAGLTRPEAVVRELVQERLRHARSVEQLGALRAEIAHAEARLAAADQEREREREKQRAEAPSAHPADQAATTLRLERQRALAYKEVEHLRQHLGSFDAESSVLHNAAYLDAQRLDRIHQLEGLIDNYKSEVQKMHAQLSALEAAAARPAPPQLSNIGGVAPVTPVGNKRIRVADDGEEPGRSADGGRNWRALQDEISSLRAQLELAQKDASVAQKQLSAQQNQSKVRILALHSNPTSDHEAVKRDTLEVLRRENDQLLEQMRAPGGEHNFALVPASTLEAAEREVAAARADTASAHKSAKRLKEVWAAKSAEFREAIASLLGWNVTMMANGKMRVESLYLPSATDAYENGIVFDGERGTMKVGGGPESPFASRIADQIGFWVRERGCIPGFLAALTMEFCDEEGSGGEGEGGQGGVSKVGA